MVGVMLDVVEETTKRILVSKLSEVNDDFSRITHILFTFPMKINLGNDVILDVETTGFMPGRASLVTVGMFVGDSIKIFQRVSTDTPSFSRFMNTYISELVKGGKNLWAFNSAFEKRWIDAPFNEIWPYKISKDTCIRLEHFGFGVGEDIPNWWHLFLAKKERETRIEHLANIVKHNFNCIVKETAIWMSQEKAFRA